MVFTAPLRGKSICMRVDGSCADGGLHGHRNREPEVKKPVGVWDPLLVPTALEAVKEWRYRPFLLNGEPVEVETTITVNFDLSY